MSRRRSGRLFAAIAATAVLAAVSTALIGSAEMRLSGIEWGLGIEWGVAPEAANGIEWGAPALHEVAVPNAD
ncbi:hypothetical protein [Verrucosispora sp. WMMC514]|uniref:hypothetical protein n=1 Tax=Verrucosispora sp. WMMC514 TaxID=3015156 RepID=UPI00248D3A43|nr:hypothetical protein [Verrucosispora sp. WMMC514]WBB92821.1 hypothetical protein O7597_07510 [Verrucosispora sp. WMMC514]